MASDLSTRPTGSAGSPHKALPARPGAITLARHGEPALSRKVRLTSAGYRAWWARYEEGGLKSGQTPPAGLVEAARSADVIVASIRPRSMETARAVSGGRTFAPHPVMVEAPLPPPRLPDLIKLSPRAWGVLARAVWWFFNHHDGQESRIQAQARARDAADHLESLAAAGGDVLVLAHGFFNAMVGNELKRRGWRLVQNEGYRYWSARRFVRG
jgi:broad specificity phosphatase PhoE